MKNLSVTIFIPAYNEEHNVRMLLRDVVRQRHVTYTLDAILVLSDGSTDNTVSAVREIQHPKIQLIHGTKRRGKVARMNQAFNIVTSDILIQLDADVRINDPRTIEKLIGPFQKNMDIGIVCGNHIPLAPKTFIETLNHFGIAVWNRTLDILGMDAIAYRCVGHVRAFGKTFYKKFTLPLIAGSAEDTYSFYEAMKQNKNVIYVPDAIVEHRLPSTITDYTKQMRRFLNERDILVHAFGESLVSRHETMNHQIKLRAFIEVSRRTPPLVVALYIVLQLLSYILPKQTPPANGIWEVSDSTKRT